MKINLNDLCTFTAVIHNKNFTKTAAQLGVTQSAVSQSICHLEEQIGLKLFNRTTRSLTVTDAGQRLFELVGKNIEEINLGLELLSSMHNKPVGKVKISADDYAIKYHLWPKLQNALKDYPDIQIELISENRRIDIAKEGYDAGVRLGNLIEKDMVAIPISSSIKMCLVASPDYISKYGRPVSIHDLKQHICLHVRILTDHSLLSWTFVENGQSLSFKGEGQLIFTNVDQILEATLCGYGISYIPQNLAMPHINQGKLSEILPEYAITHPPFYLFYTSRKHISPAFSIIKDVLKQS
ncbi:LysR family transcriptional regulator [Acinetobacter nematophilus]|uniref:LysR family transcriptional regulator n=1 Tax=Acinetobacter nematophilus TaxID=2994642 RepID=A0A9X3DT87_9GAMM|nr:LysR family transcriptional regulator [Acinetobacter nematophilus]MCX5467705.1 LysR family transcriptional regulator [Acinetobacter nematophilus]